MEDLVNDHRHKSDKSVYPRRNIVTMMVLYGSELSWIARIGYSLFSIMACTIGLFLFQVVVGIFSRAKSSRQLSGLLFLAYRSPLALPV
jgi:hypothetical protein